MIGGGGARPLALENVAFGELKKTLFQALF